MTSELLDNSDREIGYFPADLVTENETTAIVIKVVAQLNRFLKSSTGTYTYLKGRKNGTADAYVNLATNPIDLSGETPGATVSYDLKAGATGVTGKVRENLWFGLSSYSAAGWKT